MVRTFAFHITGRLPGPHWTSYWVKAYKAQLKSAYLCIINSTQKKADSALYYSLYFELLARKTAKYNIQLQNMYNVNKKGFLIGYFQKTKRIFTKSTFDTRQMQHICQDGNREWITILATICIDGSHLSPSLIYQAIFGNIQDTWL